MADIELVIKIPEEMWERIKDGYVPLGISKYLKNGTPIPDNATNDDVLKALFDERGYIGIHDRMMHTKWLFAPYQKGGKE